MDMKLLNGYLALKQCLLRDLDIVDPLQVLHKVVALHATGIANSYISLWARMPTFSKSIMETALYDKRTLVKLRCMRESIFIVPSDEMPYFHQAFAESHRKRVRDVEWLISEVGLADDKKATCMLRQLQDKVLTTLAERGPSTVREISKNVPELTARMEYKVGKTSGSLSLGSRLVPSMCDMGLLVRGRPRGTWKSNLYEYALLSEWLPEANLESITSDEAKTWLVDRYLAAFGPATLEDIIWWTGFAGGETEAALERSRNRIDIIRIDESDVDFLASSTDLSNLKSFRSAESPYVFILPALDLYIMGFRNRERFLKVDHFEKVLTRDGNAVPTVWVDGRVVGVWGQRKDGSIVYGLFEEVWDLEKMILEAKFQKLEQFLQGEVIPLPFKTKFLRSQI